MKNKFDGQKPARLGTPKNPARLRVKTKKRAQEVQAQLTQQGWHGEVEIDRGQPEDVVDLDLLQNPVPTRIVETKIGRNAPCSCGSGRKYKKCCGQ